MKVLRFELSGKNAFFKNPEVNTYYYYTYGHIHKPALLGMFGAIIGYKGYSHKYEEFPEYYDKLNGLEISVIPMEPKGCFSKKMQFFNNTIGYASNELGGNLIVKEQWLDNPAWIIYVKINNEESEKLADMIIHNRCTYIPYLGKNDHPAIIRNSVIIEMKEKDVTDEKIHSLVPIENVKFDWFEMSFRYEEYLPVALNKATNHYETKKFVLTDALVEECQNAYNDGAKNIVFY